MQQERNINHTEDINRMSGWLPPQLRKISRMSGVLKSLGKNDRIKYGGTEHGDIFYFGRDNDTRDLRSSRFL